LLAREDFAGVIKNAMSGLGFDADVAMVCFPIDLFMAESDLTPVEAVGSAFATRLMDWKPTATEIGLRNAPMVTIQGEDYEDAANQLHNQFLMNTWGDGLPVNPPTEKRVAWISAGTDLPRDHIVGKLMPRGGIVTVETAAVSLAMAGGRPEYLPVLLAAIEAILDPGLKHAQWQASSGSQFPVVIVNGPIGNQIRLNSGFGLLGPDPQRPAGMAIGRAIRLLQQNVGGAVPGVGTMAIFGPMRATNAVFAEDEENLPPGWAPFATDRHGFAPGTNAVTVVACSGAMNIMRRGTGKETAEEDIEQGLNRVARYLSQATFHYLAGYEHGTPGVLMMSGALASRFAELGWDKARFKQAIWDRTKISRADLEACGLSQWLEMDSSETVRASLNQDPWPISADPDNLAFVVAGGGHPTHNFWFQANSPRVVGRVIETPKAFNALLKRADQDLGCGADICMV
jgi:hypothetical protein